MSEKKNALQNPVFAAFVAVFCQILWGTAFPVIKKCYALFSIHTVTETFVFAGTRFTIAGFVLLLIYSLQNKKLPVLQEKGAMRFLLLFGTLQTGLSYGLQFTAMVRASSISCSIITGTGGMFATIFAALLYKNEKLTLKKALGIMIGFSGVLFCMLYKGTGAASFSFLGEGLMLSSIITFNFITVLSKEKTNQITPVLVSGYSLLFGGVELLVLGLALGGRLGRGGVGGWAGLLFIAGISSFCLLIWMALYANQPVAKIAISQSVNPVSGAIAAALLLGENVFQVKYMVALLLVVVGILVIYYEPSSKAKLS